MSNKVMLEQTCHFLNDTINIENFNPNSIKIDEKSYKNILIYILFGYVTMKDSKCIKIIV